MVLSLVKLLVSSMQYLIGSWITTRDCKKPIQESSEGVENAATTASLSSSNDILWKLGRFGPGAKSDEFLGLDSGKLLNYAFSVDRNLTGALCVQLEDATRELEEVKRRFAQSVSDCDAELQKKTKECLSKHQDTEKALGTVSKYEEEIVKLHDALEKTRKEQKEREAKHDEEKRALLEHYERFQKRVIPSQTAVAPYEAGVQKPNPRSELSDITVNEQNEQSVGNGKSSTEQSVIPDVKAQLCNPVQQRNGNSADVAALKNQIAFLTDENQNIPTLKEKINELEEHNANLTEHFREEKEAISTTTRFLKDKVEKIDSEKWKLQQEHASLIEYKNALEEKVDSFDKDNRALTEKIDTLKAENVAMAADQFKADIEYHMKNTQKYRDDATSQYSVQISEASDEAERLQAENNARLEEQRKAENFGPLLQFFKECHEAETLVLTKKQEQVVKHLLDCAVYSAQCDVSEQEDFDCLMEIKLRREDITGKQSDVLKEIFREWVYKGRPQNY